MMKNLFAFALLVLLSASSALGQTDMKRIYEATTMHWYGIDYSQTRFIGPVGFNEPERLQDHYFDAWNDVINDEYEKYSFEEFFLMETVERRMDLVRKQNQSAENVPGRIIDGDFSLSREQVIEILSNYSYDIDNGIALHVVMESLNKTETHATAYWVFVDPGTRTIIHMERMEGKAAGFGFRNYWIRPIMEMLDAFDKANKRTKKEVEKGR